MSERTEHGHKPPPQVATTGHEWDGIHELNTPLPRWWLWLFYATIIWAIGYWIVYPSWPLASSATQANADAPDASTLIKRYPKALARDYDGNPGRITEADALIAYLQVLGTLVDFKLYDDKANVR